MTENPPRRQVRPVVENPDGTTSRTPTRDGRPLLNFRSPRVSQPPQHLADMTMDERTAVVKEMGLPGFRAKQLSTHYFVHHTTDPEAMTDLPKDRRAELVERFFPPLSTGCGRRTATRSSSCGGCSTARSSSPCSCATATGSPCACPRSAAAA